MLSDQALRYVQDASHCGPFSEATHYGVAGAPGEGPYFKLWAKIVDSRVLRMTYDSFGCATSRAIGSAICQVAEDRNLADLEIINTSFLYALIGGVPEGKEYIATLAVSSLKQLMFTESNHAE